MLTYPSMSIQCPARITEYTLDGWNKKISTSIGPRLRLGFRNNSYVIGFTSKKTNNTIFPQENDVCDTMKEHVYNMKWM